MCFGWTSFWVPKMLKPVYQTIMTPDKGNCFAACLATVLGLPLDAVPNFCARGTKWWRDLQEWLDEKGLVAISVELTASSLGWLPAGIPVILSGKSPRGDWLHAVVGVTESCGFRLYHDPHPDGGFLAEEPTSALFIAPLRPDRLLEDKVALLYK